MTVVAAGWSVTCGAVLMVSVWLVCALGPPSRIIVWPSKSWLVDVPAVSVSLSVTV